MELRVFLGASPSRMEVHGQVSKKPGMQKAENSPAQFEAKNAIKPQQDSKRETKHSECAPMQSECEYRSSTWGRVNRDLPALTEPLPQPRSPVGCR